MGIGEPRYYEAATIGPSLVRNAPAASNQRLADKMMAEGKLSPDAHATVTSYVALHGGRIEDALIENGLVSEADLLRYVATQHNTRFVSTEKLYKANIDQRILALIPRSRHRQRSCSAGLISGFATREAD